MQLRFSFFDVVKLESNVAGSGVHSHEARIHGFLASGMFIVCESFDFMFGSFFLFHV